MYYITRLYELKAKHNFKIGDVGKYLNINPSLLSQAKKGNRSLSEDQEQRLKRFIESPVIYERMGKKLDDDSLWELIRVAEAQLQQLAVVEERLKELLEKIRIENFIHKERPPMS